MSEIKSTGEEVFWVLAGLCLLLVGAATVIAALRLH